MLGIQWHIWHNNIKGELHGYTVYQWYQILYYPTNALKYIKTLNKPIKLIKVVQTCFGSRRNHHQGFTNLFKRTNLKIAFRPSNILYQQLSQKSNNANPNRIYHLKCNTCNRAYIGQSGRPKTIRHREHLQYIRNNNPTSAYTMHSG